MRRYQQQQKHIRYEGKNNYQTLTTVTCSQKACAFVDQYWPSAAQMPLKIGSSLIVWFALTVEPMHWQCRIHPILPSEAAKDGLSESG